MIRTPADAVTDADYTEACVAALNPAELGQAVDEMVDQIVDNAIAALPKLYPELTATDLPVLPDGFRDVVRVAALGRWRGWLEWIVFEMRFDDSALPDDRSRRLRMFQRQFGTCVVSLVEATPPLDTPV